MANDLLSLADITLLNDQNVSDIDVDDLLIDAPVIANLAAVPASNGDVHKYLKTITPPTVGFRSVNDGREHKSSERELVTINLKLLDASFSVDSALGNIYSMEELQRMELTMHLRSAFNKLERQLFYGTAETGSTTGDTAGFAGLGNELADTADSMIHNAGGSGSDLTSVWFIRTMPSEVAIVAGNQGRIDVDAPVLQRMDGATGYYGGWFTNVKGWYGVQLGSATSFAVRICNIGASANKVTDDLLFEALEKFPSSKQPNLCVMNRRSLFDLRASRTATNGTGQPAPIPTTVVGGIPVVVTDTLINSETQVAAP